MRAVDVRTDDLQAAPPVTRIDRGLLALILVLTAIKGTLWSMAIPLWQGPDEDRHFAAVQFIAEHRRLPGAEEVYHDDENVAVGELAEVSRLWYNPGQRQTFGPAGAGPNEAAIAALDPSLRTSTARNKITLALHLPPLYYVLGALFYLPVRSHDILGRVFAVRQLSVLLGVGSVWCAFLVARQVFPRQRGMWFTVPILVSFQPMFTFVCSVVNTDALMVAVSSALIYVLIRALKSELNWKLGIATGALLGAGLLTKPFILAMLVPLGAVIAWEFRRSSGRRGRLALALGALVISLALVWGGWVVHSARLGDSPFYANPIRVGQLQVEHPFYDYRLGPYVADYVRSLLGGTWASFWGDFGWIETPLDAPYYLALYAIAALAALGLVVHVVQLYRRRTLGAQAGLPGFLVLCTAALIGTLGATNFYSWRARGVGGGIQGRYYLGAVIPLAALLALGLLALIPERWRPLGHLVLCWGGILLNLASLFQVVLPRYYL